MTDLPWDEKVIGAMRTSLVLSAILLLMAPAAHAQAEPGSGSVVAIAQSSPNVMPTASVGQAPMNSAMRQAQSASQPSASTPPPSVQGTPTNAMTLTLRSAGDEQNALSPSSAARSTAPSTGQQGGVTYDEYGIRTATPANGNSGTAQ